MNRGTGFRPDRSQKFDRSHSDAYPTHRRMMGGKLLLGRPDVTGYWPAGGAIYQGPYGSCVCTNGIKGSIAIWNAIRGNGLVLVSDMAAYYPARAIERVDMYRNPDLAPPLHDIGCVPEFAMRAIEKVGLVLEEDYPGPASGVESPSLISLEPSPGILAKAYDARGMAWHSIVGDFYEEAAACLMRGLPVALAVNVNQLGDPGNAIVQTLPSAGQNHFVSLLDVSDPEWDRLSNSWHKPGSPWGEQGSDKTVGTWRVKKGVLPLAASNVLALDVAPLVRRTRP